MKIMTVVKDAGFRMKCPVFFFKHAQFNVVTEMLS